MDFTGVGALAAVLAALGGVVKLVLDALAKQDERHNEAMNKMQERNEKFLGNHMSGNTAALEKVAKQLEALTAEAQAAHLRERERERYRTDEGGKT